MLLIPAAMQILFNVFDEWETPKSQQATVLGISPLTPTRYHQGALPQKTNTIAQVEDLPRIEMMVLFSQGKQAKWIANKNAKFGDLSSIEHMSKNGTGEVRQYLENAVYAGE